MDDRVLGREGIGLLGGARPGPVGPAARGSRAEEHGVLIPHGPGGAPVDGHGVAPGAPEAPGGPRVTGPGRLERSYQDRIRGLEVEVERRVSALSTLRKELDVSQLVERGTARWADRVEDQVDIARRQANRLLVTLGALQRENEALRTELDGARSRLARLDSPGEPRRSWWQRALGR